MKPFGKVWVTLNLLVFLMMIHLGGICSQVTAAKKNLFSQEELKYVLGRWTWTAYKTKRFTSGKSDEPMRKDGVIPHGEMEFTPDLRYSFKVVDPPNHKRSLEAAGTFLVEDDQRLSDLDGFILRLNADAPKQRIQILRERNRIAKKTDTEEWLWGTKLNEDSFEVYLDIAPLEWLGTERAFLVFTRQKAAEAVRSAPSAKPVEIALGMTEQEVIAAAGEPQSKALLGEKTLFRYETMIVTFANGKVSDVAFR